MKKRDDIKDICKEFGISRHFVEFVWGVLQGKIVLESKLPPLGKFKPRTKRECALACGICMEHMRTLPQPGDTIQ